MAERTDSGGGPNGEVETISLIPKTKGNNAVINPVDNDEALNAYEDEVEMEEVPTAPRVKRKKRVKRKAKPKVKRKSKPKAKAKTSTKPKAKAKAKTKPKPTIKPITRSKSPVEDSSLKVKAKMERTLASKRKNREVEDPSEVAPTLQEQIQRKRPLSLSSLKSRKEVSATTPPTLRPEKAVVPVVPVKKIEPAKTLLKPETPKEEAFLPKNGNLKLGLPSARVSKVVEISSVDQITKEKGLVKSYSVKEGSSLFNSIVSNINREGKGGMEVIPLTVNSKIHSIIGDAVSKWESLGDTYAKFPRYHRLEENPNTNSQSLKTTVYRVVYFPSLYISNRGAFHIVLEVKIVPPLSQSQSESTNENKGKITKVLLVNPSLLN